MRITYDAVKNFLLLCLFTIAVLPHDAGAQAVLYPNTFSGTMRFSNSNPEVVAILNTTNQARETWVYADSVGVTPPISSGLPLSPKQRCVTCLWMNSARKRLFPMRPTEPRRFRFSPALPAIRPWS